MSRGGMRLLNLIRPLFNIASQHGRRAHATASRAHVELRVMSPVQHAAFGERLRDTLLRVEGVSRVDVNAALGRAIVVFDRAICELEAIVEVVDRVESELGLDAVAFPLERPEHPGDVEPLVRCLIELGGDIVGLGMAVVGRVVRVPTLPVEFNVLAFLSLFDAPRLRAVAEEQLGRQTTSFLLTLANSFAQGLAQSPLGPMVDIGYHGLVLVERLARRSAWIEREPGLCADGHSDAPPGEPLPRPVPLPPGPIERYADAALLGSLGAFGVGLATTGSIADATAPLLSGLPKPARLGREAFASHLARVLALRGVLPLDRQALRRLDRIDCLVLPARLLLRADVVPGTLVVSHPIEPAAARGRFTELFDPTCATAVWQQDGWTLAALRPEAVVGTDVHEPHRLALRHGDTVMAIAEVQVSLDPDAEALLSAARDASMRVVVTARPGAALLDLGVDEVLVDDAGLAEEVRRLQREGRVVCAVSAGPHPMLAVADCGVALMPGGTLPAWDAHVLAGESLDDARFVVDACRAARRVAMQSVELAGAGAAVGLLISFAGLSPDASGRVMSAVNVASILALANGVRMSAALALKPPPARRDTTPWHALDATSVLDRLCTSLDGLPRAEALRRMIPPPSPPGTLVRLGEAVVDQLRNPLTPLLAVGAGLSAAAGSIVDAGMVTAVVALNALIGGVQRVRTDHAIDALAGDTRPTVCVRRDGAEGRVDAGEIVAGDVVSLRAGDTVPADCRIVEAMGLEADESTLTGESLPVRKAPAPSRAPAVADRTSMLYEGTSIAAGSTVAVVVAVGNDTEARRVATAARGRKPREGVEARLESLTSMMVPAAVIGGAAVGMSGLIRGRPGHEVLGTGTSLAVAAVPEGLPLLATVAQLAAARRLSERGVLVRNPRTIEALGRVDVVCLDKTGTVTEGRLRLRSVWHAGTETDTARLDASARAILAAALRASPDADDGAVLPHPTDRALVDGARDAQVTVGEGTSGWLRLAELPFEPGRGFHAVLGRTAEGLLASVKGAPETVLARCCEHRRGDVTLRLDADALARLEEDASRLAGQGLRVLAVAERGLPLDAVCDATNVTDLCFRGFVALSDPVRATASASLHGMRLAGVEAVMMTGDHPSTASRIAGELGLGSDGPVITGPELDEMDDTVLAVVLDRTRVFARVTPAHKVRLVGAFQRAGRVVAMTGDGANDAAAIRMANVGIALGRGAASALDAADLVVTDDRIETLVDAILEGRAMWVSVRDAVAVLVGGNLGELGFAVASGVLSGRSPLNARQLLLVNLLTDVAPAMAIALRPPPHASAAALLYEGPEASLGSALTDEIVWRAMTTAGAAGGAWLAARPGRSPAHASTVAFVALVGAQLGQTLARGGRSPLVIATGLGTFAALGAIVQTPGLSQLCGCTPLGPIGWTTALGAAGLATVASSALPDIWPSGRAWLGERARELADTWPERMRPDWSL